MATSTNSVDKNYAANPEYQSTCGGGSCEDENGCCRNNDQEKTAAITKSFLIQYVCYSCRTVVDKMKVIPHYVLSDINRLKNRKEMENEIKDFLL